MVLVMLVVRGGLCHVLGATLGAREGCGVEGGDDKTLSSSSSRVEDPFERLFASTTTGDGERATG